MQINPRKMMQVREMGEQFQKNHPKLTPFFQAAGDAVDSGSVISVDLTTSEGKHLCTNILVSEEDMELIRKIRESLV